MNEAAAQVNLGLRLLDDQLIDSDEHRCGRVDDVELQGGPGQETAVAALLIGAGAWPRRVRSPFSRVLGGLTPGYMDCVPWSAVRDVATTVKLSLPAKELGLGTDDGRNARWVNDPIDRLRLSALLGAQVVTSQGEKLGRIREVRAERQTAIPDEEVNEPWLVTGLLIGWLGLKERLGLSNEANLRGNREFIPWEAVLERSPRTVTVSHERPPR
jgi:sporulation protein YlmC with PRC-barrel domain